MLDRIVSEIEAGGPMGFDRYMELCLYDPEEGFFATGVRSTASADFVTSPEVSPWFGRLVGRWAASVRPGPGSMLIDVGAGSGSLLAASVPEVGDAFASVYAVEVSPGARDSIADTVPGITVVSDLRDIPRADAVIVANELLDNLPTRLVERAHDAWYELRVGAAGGALRFETVAADAELSSWCDRHLGTVPAGSLLAAQMRIPAWLHDVAQAFGWLQVAVIDYAADTETLARRPRNGVIRGFARHASVRDPLADPGAGDLTVEANLDVIRAGALAAGFEVRVTDQRSLLLSIGAEDELERLVEREHDLARSGDTMAQLRARSEAVGLRALLDPEGLGGFTVILLTSVPSESREPGIEAGRHIMDGEEAT